MTTEQNIVIRRAAEAQDRGNVEAFLGLLAEGYQLYFPGQQQALGREGHVQVVRSFRAAFPGGRHVPAAQVAEGDRVVTRGTWHGTHLGEFQGMPPTGKRVEIGWIMFARLTGGRLTEVRLHADMLGMLRQLGAMPEAARATA